MNLTLPTLLCLSSSIESLVIYWVLQRTKDIDFNFIILVSEFVKLIASTVLYIILRGEEHKLNIDNTLYFIPPSAVYIVGNIATLTSLKYITPALYSLLTTTKIPLIIFLGLLFLNHQSRTQKLVSMLLMIIGNIIPFIHKDISIFEYIGVYYSCIYVLCSCIATIYNEYIIHTKFKDEFIFGQNIKFYLCGVVLNSFNWLYFYNDAKIIDPMSVLIIIMMSIVGILTSLVIKFHNSVVKVYSTSTSIFLTTVLSWLIFSNDISIDFILGGTVCGTGIWLYIQSISQPPTDEEVLLIQPQDV